MVIWSEHLELVCPCKNFKVLALFIISIEVHKGNNFFVFGPRKHHVSIFRGKILSAHLNITLIGALHSSDCCHLIDR